MDPSEEVNIAVVPFVGVANMSMSVVPVVGQVGDRPGPGRAMLLTNRRAILVPRKRIHWGATVLLFGAAGAYYADATAEVRRLDSQTADAPALASEPYSIVVPHEAITSLSMTPGLLFPFMRVKFTDPHGKDRHLDLVVRPPPELLNEQKRQGMSRKEAARQYAAMVRDAYLRALPPEIATRASWRF